MVKYANIGSIYALNCFSYKKIIKSLKYTLRSNTNKFTSICQICSIFHAFSPNDTETEYWYFRFFWHTDTYSVLFRLNTDTYWYFSIWKSYWILNTSIFILYWSGLWIAKFLPLFSESQGDAGEKSSKRCQNVQPFRHVHVLLSRSRFYPDFTLILSK